MFIIPCKWVSGCPVLDCVNSVIKFHPNEKIVVVDSASDDKSYALLLPPNVIFADIANKNYLEGALWYCYETFKDENFFYLIQDSMVLTSNLDFAKKTDFTHTIYFKFHYNPIYGAETMEKFCQAQLQKIPKYRYLKPKYAVCGPTVFLKRGLLDRLKSNGFNQLLPTCKMEEEAMERIWAIVLTQEGYDIQKTGLVYNKDYPSNPYFIKTWLARQ